MRKLVTFGLGAMFIAAVANAADPAALDPCALVPKADVAKIIGEIKEVKTTEGLRKEKQCDYMNMEGSWLKVSVYSAEHWEMVKISAIDPTDIKGLGEEAYGAKRGTSREIYVRKGKLMLAVSSTVGAEKTQQIAAAAAKQLP